MCSVSILAIMVICGYGSLPWSFFATWRETNEVKAGTADCADERRILSQEIWFESGLEICGICVICGYGCVPCFFLASWREMDEAKAGTADCADERRILRQKNWFESGF